MTKWEYKQETQFTNDLRRSDVLNLSGMEGWELCSMTAVSGNVVAYFKRPIKEEVAEVCPKPDKWMGTMPERVVINAEGEAISPSHALRQGITSVDVIFIRDDGWSLGAPKGLEDVAESSWKDKWVMVIWRNTIMSYVTYRGVREN